MLLKKSKYLFTKNAYLFLLKTHIYIYIQFESLNLLLSINSNIKSHLFFLFTIITRNQRSQLQRIIKIKRVAKNDPKLTNQPIEIHSFFYNNTNKTTFEFASNLKSKYLKK